MIEAKAGEKTRIAFTLNGKVVSGEAEPRMQLADFLRHVLNAHGTHVGCEHGICGACTVIVDGRAVRSCLLYAVQVDGSRIDTVEGLNRNSEGLTDLQEAFRRHYALQCGFCTAGILMSTTQFLDENPEPTEHEVREMLSGHICRCTGYRGIVDAILDTARQRAAKPKVTPEIEKDE